MPRIQDVDAITPLLLDKIPISRAGGSTPICATIEGIINVDPRTNRLSLHNVQSVTGPIAVTTFSAFYHVFSIVHKNTGVVYAISTAVTGQTTQSIYKSLDGGVNWTSMGNITVDIAGGDRLSKIYVEPRGETIVILKSKNTSPATYEVNTYNSTLSLLGSLDIGKATWHSAMHNVDATVLDGTYDNVIMFAEYVNTSAGAVATVRVWKTVDRGINWTVAFEQTADNGTTGSGEVRHFHTLQVDPFTNDWWLSSGDSNAQCKIWRSQNDGIDWTLLYSGSQEERTLSFVFELNHVYYGMDSPDSGIDTNIYKITRATMDKEVVAVAWNNLAVYSLTKTFYPDGFLVWLVYESASSAPTDVVKIQFFDYKTNKLINAGEILKTITFTGFLEASRYQSLQDGGIFVTPMDLGIIYGGNTSTRSAFLKAKLTV